HVGGGIAGDDVELAVAIQVSDCDAASEVAAAGRQGDRRVEAAAAVGQQDVDGVAVPQGHGDVEVPVAVEVTGRDGERLGSRGVGRGRPEPAAPVSGEHADG